MNCEFQQHGDYKVCQFCDQPPVLLPENENLLRACKRNIPPSWLKVILTFIKALYRHARNWFRKAGWLLRRERYNTCLNCPGSYLIHEGTKKNRCKICWCIVEEKVIWASEKCPAKFWPEQQQPKNDKKVTA